MTFNLDIWHGELVIFGIEVKSVGRRNSHARSRSEAPSESFSSLLHSGTATLLTEVYCDFSRRSRLALAYGVVRRFLESTGNWGGISNRPAAAAAACVTLEPISFTRGTTDQSATRPTREN